VWLNACGTYGPWDGKIKKHGVGYRSIEIDKDSGSTATLTWYTTLRPVSSRRDLTQAALRLTLTLNFSMTLLPGVAA
jgi:hypothetical protein